MSTPITTLRFTVLGPPVPAARARVVHRSGQRARAFTPDTTRDYERLVGLHARAAVSRCAGWRLDARYAITMAFYRDVERGDIDNHEKAVLDGCNKIAWADDRLVRRISAELLSDRERPRAEIVIEMLEVDVVAKRPRRARKTTALPMIGGSNG